jgi:D-sedoheptulose 7-phosphate isomerase
MVGTIRVLALDIDGVLTDGRASIAAAADEQKRYSFHDLDGITRAKRAGLTLAFITGEQNALAEAIARRFGVELLVQGAKDKVAALERLSKELGVPLSEFAFVGDSDRDAAGFSAVGLGLATADATPGARRAAHRVLSLPGGGGAAAEAVDLVLRLNADREESPKLQGEITRIIRDSIRAHQALLDESAPVLSEVAIAVTHAIRSGRKVLLFGNGGSAADAQHVAGELVGRFLKESQPWPAIALTTDSSILTCVGNDWEFEDVFARQVRALARPGDVVVGISTSGNSPNVVRGLNDARAVGATTIGFTGRKGGKMGDADICFRAPSDLTPRIQELHLLAWHAICELVEVRLMD